jgi:nitrite reductase/ring-hydroxylating ferredoxin subunit
MSNYVKVAAVGQVPADRGLQVEVGGKRLGIFCVAGNYYAVSDECTHVGGPLSEGTVMGEDVFCPWHGARFRIATGEVLGGPARAPVACFPVRVNGDDVEVAIDF